MARRGNCTPRKLHALPRGPRIRRRAEAVRIAAPGPARSDGRSAQPPLCSRSQLYSILLSAAPRRHHSRRHYPTTPRSHASPTHSTLRPLLHHSRPTPPLTPYSALCPTLTLTTTPRHYYAHPRRHCPTPRPTRHHAAATAPRHATPRPTHASTPRAPAALGAARCHNLSHSQQLVAHSTGKRRRLRRGCLTSPAPAPARRGASRLDAVSGYGPGVAGARARPRRAGTRGPAGVFLSYWPRLLRAGPSVG